MSIFVRTLRIDRGVFIRWSNNYSLIWRPIHAEVAIDGPNDGNNGCRPLLGTFSINVDILEKVRCSCSHSGKKDTERTEISVQQRRLG